jgi:hypothetical protein
LRLNQFVVRRAGTPSDSPDDVAEWFAVMNNDLLIGSGCGRQKVPRARRARKPSASYMQLAAWPARVNGNYLTFPGPEFGVIYQHGAHDDYPDWAVAERDGPGSGVSRSLPFPPPLDPVQLFPGSAWN